MFRFKSRTHRQMSLEVRLVLFALLCAVPVMTLTVLQMVADSARIRQQAIDATDAAADRVQQRIARLLGAAEGVAHAIGAVDIGQAQAPRLCSGALARAIAAASPYMLNYSLSRPTGELVCSARPVNTPVNSADRAYFQEALRLKRPVLSGFTVGRVTRQEALQLAVPVLDERDDAVTAVAIVALSGKPLTDRLNDTTDPPLTALLFDRDGVLVSRSSDEGSVSRGRSYASSEVFQRTRMLDPGPATLPGLDGTVRLYAFRSVVYQGEPVLWVAVGAELRTLEQSALSARWRDFVLVFLVTLAVAGTAIAMTQPVVLARCRGLIDVARQVARGDYAPRIPLTVRDPLQEVEALVNQMLDAIESDRRELRDSESRYRLLFENSLDGVLQTTPDGGVLAANASACRILGRSEAELLRSNRAELCDLGDPRLGELIRQRQENGAARGGLRMVRSDGTTFECELASRVYRDSQDRQMTCLVIRDVTDRHRNEERILHLNRTLEQRVLRRTAELENAYRELEAFSYSVSHDLRAPVAVVSSFTSVLEASGAVTGEKPRHYLHRIGVAARHMNDLIEGLLALTQIGRASLDLSPIDLSALAREAAQQCADAAPDHPVQFEVEPGLRVVADPRLMRIVLSNLIGNAWKFTRGQAQPRVRFGLEADQDGELAFCVRDNGVGFDPAYAHRLFEAFQRLHTTTEFPGVGIGLATVRQIVERHGGRIWAQAQPGQGAAFFFFVQGDDSTDFNPFAVANRSGATVL